MIASTFSIVVVPSPCTAHCLADVLFNALPTAAVTAATRTISQDRHSLGKEGVEEGHGNCSGNVQFISVHFFLPPFVVGGASAAAAAAVVHCTALAPMATPTIDVDVAYFRFWHVAPLTFRNCPCPCAVSMSPCRPVCLSLSPMLISIESPPLSHSLALQVRLFHVCLGCHLAVVVLGII